MRCVVSCGSTSFPWLVFFFGALLRVHDSQAYRKMDVTRERISCILELREMLMSFQTGFNLVSATVVCAILEYLGLGNIFSYSWAQVLEACNSLKLLSIYFDLCVDATGVVCHQLGLLSNDLPQWGAVDTEIKFPSDENTELKRSPFKAWSRSVYSYTCYSYCQGFLPCLFLPSSPFTCIFSKTSPNFFLCWLWLTPVPV